MERSAAGPRPGDDEGPSPLQFTVRAASGASCLYCREAFEESESILTCEACEAGYHRDCLSQELGRCATLGCLGKRALPRRARSDGDYAHERLLRDCFEGQPGCVFVPLPPRGVERAQKRFAKQLSKDETPLVLILDPGTGAPLALFTDRTAYLDLRGLEDGSRLPYAELKQVRHEAGALRYVTEGGGGRAVFLRQVPQRALRRFFDQLLEQPWEPAQGFACDVCLQDFEPMDRLLECTGCHACQHPDCQTDGRCPGRGCDGEADVRLRLAAAQRYGPWAESTTPRVLTESCGKCRRPFPGGDQILTCEGCGAVYHPGCLLELGNCATRGCQGKRALPGRQPRSYLSWVVVAFLLGLLALAALAGA